MTGDKIFSLMRAEIETLRADNQTLLEALLT